MAPVQQPASNSDARKRREHEAAVGDLEDAIARFLHKQWCDVPGHSWGNPDFYEAQELAVVIRAHVAAGGAL